MTWTTTLPPLPPLKSDLLGHQFVHDKEANFLFTKRAQVAVQRNAMPGHRSIVHFFMGIRQVQNGPRWRWA